MVDKRNRGSVGKFLSSKIKPEAELPFVSAYFTVFAYQQKRELREAKHLRFLFSEPAFIKSLADENSNQRSVEILDEPITIPIQERLTQKSVAKDYAKWLREKADIKPNFLHGKLYLVEDANGVKEGNSWKLKLHRQASRTKRQTKYRTEFNNKRPGVDWKT